MGSDCWRNRVSGEKTVSWIPIIVQSFTPVSRLGFEIPLSKLNNNENKKAKEPILQFSPFLCVKPNGDESHLFRTTSAALLFSFITSGTWR